MKQSLATITAKMMELEEKLLEINGELNADMELALDELHAELSQKIDSYRYQLWKLNTLEKMMLEKSKHFANASKTCKKAQEYLKNKLKQHMEITGNKKLFGKNDTITLCKSRDKLIIDEDLLEQKWKLQEFRWVPDKEKIRRALEDGNEVKGAKLRPSSSLRFGVNRGMTNDDGASDG